MQGGRANLTSRASAPGKVILFGEHFVVHGTRAVLAAIDRRITAVSEATEEPVIRIDTALGSEEIGVSESCRTPELRPLEFLAKKMISMHSHPGGIAVKIKSGIPHGVGLGSSSASCVAAAASMSGLFAKYPREEICSMAVEAERTIFENTSGADCAVCTHGGIIAYDRDSGFQSMGSGAGLRLVISDSGAVHSTKSVVAGVAKYREENPARFEELCRKESGLIRRAEAQIRDGDAAGVGRSMNENQEYLEEIGVSNARLEEIIRLARPHSLGSKITGAGGGGCVISATPSPDLAVKAMRELGVRSFGAGIDRAGLETF